MAVGRDLSKLLLEHQDALSIKLGAGRAASRRVGAVGLLSHPV